VTDESRRMQNLTAVARHLATSAPEKPPPAPEPSPARRWARWGSLGLVLAFVAGKFKFVLALLKFAKLGTLASMLVAVGAYTVLWGLPFAVGFVLLIFVHELGHAIAMRRLGIPAGAPVFIPFVGAVIAMKGLPRDAGVEAVVAIAGPILGSAGAFACLVVGWTTAEPFWYALASTGFLINLFNLIPISPLDGGRIVGVLSRWLWVAGYAIGVAVLLVTWHPLLLLILVVGLLGIRRRIRGPRPGYWEVSPARRLAVGIAYFGLAGLLALAMWSTDRRLASFSPERGVTMNETKAAPREVTQMQGKFDLKRSRGQYVFNLKATNGRVILTSERYTTKKAALHGIRAVRRNAKAARNYDLRRARNGEPYFVLVAGNGEIIGRSEGYSSPARCNVGIASVRRNGPTAKVEDNT